MATRECILRCLLTLKSVIDIELDDRYHHPELGPIPGTVDVWVNDLAGLTDEQVTVAFSHFRRTVTGDFNRKPRPGDITQFIERIQNGGWLAGWREYLERAEVSGMFGAALEQQEWSSPLVEAAVNACGGVRALATSDPSKHGFLKSQFQQAYDRALEAQQTQQTLAALKYPQIGQSVPAPIAQIAEARARREPRPPLELCPYTEPEQVIDWLKELRVKQMGSGPLKPLRQPITEAPGPAPKQLGGYLPRHLPAIVGERALVQIVSGEQPEVKEA